MYLIPYRNVIWQESVVLHPKAFEAGRDIRFHVGE